MAMPLSYAMLLRAGAENAMRRCASYAAVCCHCLPTQNRRCHAARRYTRHAVPLLLIDGYLQRICLRAQCAPVLLIAMRVYARLAAAMPAACSFAADAACLRVMS